MNKNYFVILCFITIINLFYIRSAIAITFDFIEKFESKINVEYIDSNSGFYNILNPYIITVNHSDIFGLDNLNITDFTISAILKFKYSDRYDGDDGLNIFKISPGFGNQIFFYTRQEDNKIGIEITIKWNKADAVFNISDNNKIDDDQWHKINFQFSKGIYKLWIDCQFIGETKSKIKDFKYIVVSKPTPLEIKLNPPLFSTPSNFKLKSLKLISGQDGAQNINKDDCTDIQQSTSHFKLDVLESLKNETNFFDSEENSFSFENSKELGDRLATIHKNYIQYNFDPDNFLIDFEIRFPHTNDLDQYSKLLDGNWHNLSYTANSVGQIRIYLDCEYVGLYLLYNIKKNLNFNSPYSVLETIFQLDLQNTKFDLKRLNIHSGGSFLESLKAACPQLKEPEETKAIICSKLKKPFKNFICSGNTQKSFQFNGLDTIKNKSPNQKSDTLGDIFRFDNFATFKGQLTENNRNLFAPNFDADDHSVEYIMREVDSNLDMLNIKWYWYKLTSVKKYNKTTVYENCKKIYGEEYSKEFWLDDKEKDLNFFKKTSLASIPSQKSHNANKFEFEILKFKVYSPAKLLNITDCEDIEKINESL